MALHDDAVEAEEDRAVVVVRIEMVRAAARSPGARSGSRAWSGSSCVKARRSRSVTNRAVPSIVFSAILPEKPSVDDHVDLAAAEPVALDEAVELASAGASAARSVAAASLQLIGALHLLGADVEQARRAAARRPEHGARIGRAHHRELDEIVAHRTRCSRRDRACTRSLSPSVGSKRGERRAIDARHGAQRELGHRHQRAGIAGRDRGAGAPASSPH